MTLEDMPRPHGVERYEAEAALETLVRAKQIESDSKLMTAVGDAAREKAADAERIANEINGEETVPRHPDRDRKDRVKF